MGKRNTEFVLGLLGGIFGIFAGILGLVVGGIDSVISGSAEIVGLGLSAILFSILGIIGASIVKNKNKLGGWFMVIAAVGGTISISWFYLISGLLLFIAGLIALIKKDGKKKK